MPGRIAARNNAVLTQRIKVRQVERRLADERQSCGSSGDIAFWQYEVSVAKAVLAQLEGGR